MNIKEQYKVAHEILDSKYQSVEEELGEFFIPSRSKEFHYGYYSKKVDPPTYLRKRRFR